MVCFTQLHYAGSAVQDQFEFYESLETVHSGIIRYSTLLGILIAIVILYKKNRQKNHSFSSSSASFFSKYHSWQILANPANDALARQYNII